jgi:short-subunit dehydrogenase
METIEELRGVKDYINHRLRFMMRKDTAEGIIKRKEEELQELKERYANSGDIRIEIKDYDKHQSVSKEQVENILKTIKKDKK